jgi:energy-coupling factor transporter ATP-binding protein EcfA2
MPFRIVDNRRDLVVSPDVVFLLSDRWDDWGKYETQFNLIFFTDTGDELDAGRVKIGQRGLQPGERTIGMAGYRSPALGREFDALGEQFFSVGQDDNYYESLNVLTKQRRESILKGLRDCAFNLKLFDEFLDEDVMQQSLLRFVRVENVRNRLHRLATGNTVLTEFEFEYVFPDGGAATAPPILTFHVVPHSDPPTNVHVLIGRNGAGKTRCLQHISRALLQSTDKDTSIGRLEYAGPNRGEWEFAGLLLVSFSAFDSFDLPVAARPGFRALKVGLVDSAQPSGVEPMMSPSPSLTRAFSSSLEQCRHKLRGERWVSAIRTLESDPLFAEIDASSLLNAEDDTWRAAAESLFRRLSSGHAIVLLAMTRLVEHLDERTLVLLDEPESHLHPPLLSAFIRTLNELLVERNGVAIVATHSPVVLQEVPANCVWILRRSGAVATTERPTLETFGENVGALTSEVFGLEVTSSGFHKLLDNAVRRGTLDYEAVLRHFAGRLGAEAKAIARSLTAGQMESGE